MATKKKSSSASTAALSPDDGVALPRLKLGEQGFLGLRTSNGRILEEVQQAFRYPAFIKTINEMRNNPTVGSALNVYTFWMNRIKWDVEPPVDGTDIDDQRAEIVESMMHDMDMTWSEFIRSVIPSIEYGFAINEIVLRRRLKRNGSKHNDGLVGIKKLPSRSQETIAKWVFNDDGSELLGVKQSLQYVENAHLFQSKKDTDGLVNIDRDKFLLFTVNKTKGNPEGNSLLKNIYLAYKQMTLLQENQLTGVAKEMQGILKIAIPPNYLSPNANDDEKATAAAFQNIIDNYNAGKQRGLLVPNVTDPETKLPMFSYELMESKGVSKYDTESIIKGYQQDILSALSVDVLKLGADGSGSFSLAESKTSILALAIDARMREIQDTLNQELMRKIYEVNGWDTTNMCKFVYEDAEEVDLDTFSSAIQRIAATGMIEVDREVLNKIRCQLGIEEKPDDEPIDKENLSTSLSGKESKSGSGMAVGTSGNGTAKIGGDSSKKDSSTANKANAP
jgi:hypothetical protein